MPNTPSSSTKKVKAPRQSATRTPKKLPVLASTGAPESNAGDQFHLLWAARRALKLLDSKSSLLLLKMEGVAPRDEMLLLEKNHENDFFLAADMTEFFGDAATFDAQNPVGTSTHIVTSQLKYSTRHPETEWTASRLVKGEGDDRTLRKLAKTYINFLDVHPRDSLIVKLRLRLVSNQAAEAQLLAALQAAQDILSTQFLAENPTLGEVNVVLRRQGLSSAIPILTTLKNGTGLSARDFTDFLRVLDLSGCGEALRLRQKAELFAEVATHVAAEASAIMRKFCERMYEEALPNRQNSRGISRVDVLAEMGVGSEDELFPAPTSFEPLPADLVATPDAAAVVKALSRSDKLLAHGGAGIGKTTTMRSLHEHLPVESVVVLFDCFDSGNYLHQNKERHTHRTALTQLTNELSIQCGSPLLVSPSDNSRVLLNWWQKALEGAAKLLDESSQGEGMLVIVIDAADNAAQAADSRHEDWFVPALWNITLPPNVRLIATSRTARRHLLKAPADVAEHTLRGFDETASGRYFDKHFQGVDPADRIKWHQRTGGNPRVQFYVAQEARRKGWNTASDLWDKWPNVWKIQPPATFDLGTIFDIGLRDAVASATDSRQGEEALAMLAVLRRPIPLAVWQRAAGLSSEVANRFCRALEPGVIVTTTPQGQFLMSRDEDYEVHLRERAAVHAPEARKHLGLFLKDEATFDSYAAAEAGEHLLAANQIDELLQLTFAEVGLHPQKDGSPPAVTDEVARVRIHRSRLRLALRGVAKVLPQESAHLADAIKILVLSAESIRTHNAVRELVHSAPDLALQHGDAATIRQLVLAPEPKEGEGFDSQSGEPWLGGTHLSLAAHYSRDPNTHDLAWENFRSAEGWMSKLSASRSEPKQGFTVADIAAGAEALLHLKDARSAVRWLRAWRPFAALEAVEDLARSLAPRYDEEQLESWLAECRWPRWGEAMFVVALWNRGRVVSCERLMRLSERLEKSVRRRGLPQIHPDGRWPGANFSEQVHWQRWSLDFAELLMRAGVDEEHCRFWLELGIPMWPLRAPHDHADHLNYFAPLRARVLHAVFSGQSLSAVALLPEHLRADRKVTPPSPQQSSINTSVRTDPEEEKRLESRSKYLSLIQSLLPWAISRSRVLVERLAVEEIEAELEKQFNVFESVGKTGGISPKDRTVFFRREMFDLFTDSLLNCKNSSAANADVLEKHLERLANALPVLMGESAPWCSMDLAARLVTRPRFYSLASRLLERATTEIMGVELPAAEKRDAMLRGSRLTCTFDSDLSRKLFRRAVEASGGLDDDSAGALDLLTNSIHRLKSSNARTNVVSSCARLVALLEGFKPYVSDGYHIPWHQAIERVLRADTAAGLALVLRWEESQECGLRESGPIAAYAGLQCAAWSPLVSLHILRFGGAQIDPTGSAQYKSGQEPRPMMRILDELDGQGLSGRQALGEALGELSRWIRCYVPVRHRESAANQVIEWAKKRNLTALGGIAELMEAADFARSLEETADDDANAGMRRIDVGQEETEDERRKQLERTDLESRATKGDVKDFAERWKRFDHLSRPGMDKPAATYLSTTQQALAPADRVAFLHELGKIEWSRVNTDALRSCLGSCLRGWHHDPDVQGWARTELPTFVTHHLHTLLGYEYNLRSNLPLLLDWPAMTVPIWLEAIANNPRQCSSQTLFIVAEVLSDRLSDPDLAPLWEWVLARNEDRLAREGHPAKAIDWSLLPEAWPQAGANFFWVLLGNPDRQVRWNALHAARGILRSRHTFDEALLCEIVRLANTENAGPLAAGLESPEFFWMSARAYALLLLEALSRDCPRCLIPHVPQISDWALDDAFPHAQIRELSKRTLLNVEQAIPGTLSSAVFQQLEALHQPIAISTGDDSSRGRLAWMQARDETAELRFQFDWMDTLTSWYDEVDKIFDLRVHETARRADRWISDIWCRTRDEFMGEHPFWSRYGWEQTSHRHGAMPRIEIPVRYYEHHAMQCAAGEMIANFPVYKGQFSSSDEPWKYWLAESLGAFELGWLSEYRSPVPLRPECWERFPRQENWRKRDETDFQAALGLNENRQEFVVASYYTYSHGSRSGSTRVESALVSPQVAESLMSALQCGGANDFRLPLYCEVPEGDYDSPYGVDTIVKPPFRLEGWLTEPPPRHDAPDTFDTWGKVPEHQHLLLGTDFISFYNLRPRLVLGAGLEYATPTKQTVAYSQVWRDSNAAESFDELLTEGQNLRVQIGALLEYLKERQVDWVGRVILRRDYTESYRRHSRDKEETTYDFGQHRIYRLQSDGTLSWLGGNLRIGTEDRG